MRLQAHELLACGRRTLDWAGSLTTASGFSGASDEILAHYKAVAALTLGGRQDAAMKIADHLQNRFRSGGDFHAHPGDRAGATNYRNAWIARGLHLLGRYEMSGPAFAHLEAQQDGRTGGILLQPTAFGGAPEFDLGSTCSAAIAFLEGGRDRAAARCGHFLAQCIKDQLPSGSRLHLRFTPEGATIVPASGSRAAFVIDSAGPPEQQLYWPLGMALTAFARLCRATGDGAWLSPAADVLAFIDKCGPAVATHITNGKVAWGLGEMSLITTEPDYRRLAETVLRNVVTAQESTGIWVRRPQYRCQQEQPVATSLDTSLERASYMFDLAKAFRD